jgi:hypothetical protein
MEVIGDPRLDESILPVFQWYKQTPGNEMLTLWNYISMRANSDLAVAFSKLFWPDFVEVDGCILLAEQYSPKAYERWKTQLHGDRLSIEQTLNDIRIWDFFLTSDKILDEHGNEQSRQVLQEFLGNVLAKCWACALREMFPTKTFILEYDPSAFYDGPRICFYQIESDSETGAVRFWHANCTSDK